jgi:hypothetical protein
VHYLSRIAFESPLWLLFSWFPVQVALLVFWSRRRTKASGRTVWVWMAMLPIGLIAQMLVTTTSERLQAVAAEIADAAERGRADEVLGYVSRDFAADGMDYERFSELLTRGLGKTRVEHIRLSHFTVTQRSGDTTTTEFDASCRIDRSDSFSGQVMTRWRVTFRDEAGTTRIIAIEALPARFSPLKSLSDIGR